MLGVVLLIGDWSFSCGYVDSADWGWFGILQLISCISLWEDFVIVARVVWSVVYGW